MSQSAKDPLPQANFARRNWPEPAGKSALIHASAALARAGFADATLVLRWTEIAGADVARVAEPLKMQEGPEGATLTLRCESGAVVFLQHDTRKLIERLNGYLGPGRIARLRLVAGKLARSHETAAPRRRRVPVPSQDDAPRPSLSEALKRLGNVRRNSVKPFRPD